MNRYQICHISGIFFDSSNHVVIINFSFLIFFHNQTFNLYGRVICDKIIYFT